MGSREKTDFTGYLPHGFSITSINPHSIGYDMFTHQLIFQVSEKTFNFLFPSFKVRQKNRQYVLTDSGKGIMPVAAVGDDLWLTHVPVSHDCCAFVSWCLGGSFFLQATILLTAACWTE